MAKSIKTILRKVDPLHHLPMC